MIENLYAELVTDDSIGGWIAAVIVAAATPAKLDHVFHVMQPMQVRAADAAGKGLDQHLTPGGLRTGDLFAKQVFVTPNYGPHCRPPGVTLIAPCRRLANSVTLKS